MARRTSRGRYLREPEIEDLGATALGYEDVCGLDVAVNDALGMSGVQRIGNFNRNRQDCFGIDRSSRDEMLQSYAVEEFHGKERLAILLTNIVNSANVGMIQGRRSLRFALEAGHRLGISRHVFGQELEGTKR